MRMKRSRFDTYRHEIPKRLPLKNFDLKVAFTRCYSDGLTYGPYTNKETGREYFYIVVDTKNNLSVQLDFFMHEYAHALNIDRGGADFGDDIKDHGREWGICYSKVYQTMLKIKAEYGFK